MARPQDVISALVADEEESTGCWPVLMTLSGRWTPPRSGELSHTRSPIFTAISPGWPHWRPSDADGFLAMAARLVRAATRSARVPARWSCSGTVRHRGLAPGLRASERPAALPRRVCGAGLGVRPPGPWPADTGRGVPLRAHRPVRRTLGVRARGRDAAHHEPGHRLLPARHQAPAARRLALTATGREAKPLAGHRPGIPQPHRVPGQFAATA